MFTPPKFPRQDLESALYVADQDAELAALILVTHHRLETTDGAREMVQEQVDQFLQREAGHE
jgi:hypothetical protein